MKFSIVSSVFLIGVLLPFMNGSPIGEKSHGGHGVGRAGADVILDKFEVTGAEHGVGEKKKQIDELLGLGSKEEEVGEHKVSKDNSGKVMKKKEQEILQTIIDLGSRESADSKEQHGKLKITETFENHAGIAETQIASAKEKLEVVPQKEIGKLAPVSLLAGQSELSSIHSKLPVSEFGQASAISAAVSNAGGSGHKVPVDSVQKTILAAAGERDAGAADYSDAFNPAPAADSPVEQEKTYQSYDSYSGGYTGGAAPAVKLAGVPQSKIKDVPGLEISKLASGPDYLGGGKMSETISFLPAGEIIPADARFEKVADSISFIPSGPSSAHEIGIEQLSDRIALIPSGDIVPADKIGIEKISDSMHLIPAKDVVPADALDFAKFSDSVSFIPAGGIPSADGLGFEEISRIPSGDIVSADKIGVDKLSFIPAKEVVPADALDFAKVSDSISFIPSGPFSTDEIGIEKLSDKVSFIPSGDIVPADKIGVDKISESISFIPAGQVVPADGIGFEKVSDKIAFIPSGDIVPADAIGFEKVSDKIAFIPSGDIVPADKIGVDKISESISLIPAGQIVPADGIGVDKFSDSISFIPAGPISADEIGIEKLSDKVSFIPSGDIVPADKIGVDKISESIAFIPAGQIVPADGIGFEKVSDKIAFIPSGDIVPADKIGVDKISESVSFLPAGQIVPADGIGFDKVSDKLAFIPSGDIVPADALGFEKISDSMSVIPAGEVVPADALDFAKVSDSVSFIPASSIAGRDNVQVAQVFKTFSNSASGGGLPVGADSFSLPVSSFSSFFGPGVKSRKTITTFYGVPSTVVRESRQIYETPDDTSSRDSGKSVKIRSVPSEFASDNFEELSKSLKPNEKLSCVVVKKETEIFGRASSADFFEQFKEAFLETFDISKIPPPPSPEELKKGAAELEAALSAAHSKVKESIEPFADASGKAKYDGNQGYDKYDYQGTTGDETEYYVTEPPSTTQPQPYGSETTTQAPPTTTVPPPHYKRNRRESAEPYQLDSREANEYDSPPHPMQEVKPPPAEISEIEALRKVPEKVIPAEQTFFEKASQVILVIKELKNALTQSLHQLVEDTSGENALNICKLSRARQTAANGSKAFVLDLLQIFASDESHAGFKHTFVEQARTALTEVVKKIKSDIDRVLDVRVAADKKVLEIIQNLESFLGDDVAEPIEEPAVKVYAAAEAPAKRYKPI